MVFSGVIYGRDPQTRQVPDDLDGQCALMFAHIKTLIEDAGGTLDNIARLTLLMADRNERETVNRHWIRYFLIRHRVRPVRHRCQTERQYSHTV